MHNNSSEDAKTIAFSIGEGSKHVAREIESNKWVTKQLEYSIERLDKTLTKYNESSEITAKRMHKLTIALLIAAAAQALATGYQAYLQSRPQSSFAKYQTNEYRGVSGVGSTAKDVKG